MIEDLFPSCFLDLPTLVSLRNLNSIKKSTSFCSASSLLPYSSQFQLIFHLVLSLTNEDGFAQPFLYMSTSIGSWIMWLKKKLILEQSSFDANPQILQYMHFTFHIKWALVWTSLRSQGIILNCPKVIFEFTLHICLPKG